MTPIQGCGQGFARSGVGQPRKAVQRRSDEKLGIENSILRNVIRKTPLLRSMQTGCRNQAARI
jgi:hypothetical protein